MSKNRRPSLIVIIIGIVFIIAGFFLLKDEIKSNRENTESCNGKVVAYDITRTENDDGGVDTYFYPILEYKVDGKTITSTYKIGEGKRKYPEGTQLEIKYNPENPESFSIVGDNRGTSLGIRAIVIGAIALLYPILKVLIQYLVAVFSQRKEEE